MDFWSLAVAVRKPTIRNLGFSGAVFTLSRHVKLVDYGTDNISHCLALYGTGSLAFDSIVLQMEIFSASAGITRGMNHEILSRLTFPALAAAALQLHRHLFS